QVLPGGGRRRRVHGLPGARQREARPALAQHDRACLQRVRAAELHHRSGAGNADARSDGRRDPTHRLHPLSARSKERTMSRETRKGLTRLLVVALALILPVTPRASTAATPSYDPATTVVVFVHGFDPDG